nr:hypothetical protein DA06_23115 [Georgenia sp. SUBG003]
MALAYPGYLQGVHGGVVRATESPRGSVSVVIGGGSGHYPAFAGWVGPGSPTVPCAGTSSRRRRRRRSAP